MEKLMAVLERFQEIKTINEKDHALKLEREAKQQQNFFNSFEEKKNVDYNNVYAKRLVECGIEVYDFLPNMEKVDSSTSHVGTFFCKKGTYIFEVKAYKSDYDFSNGSLEIKGVYEESTRKFCTLPFDFLETEILDDTFESILFLLENGVKCYVEKYFGIYMELPELLEKEGYDAVVSKDYDFSPFQNSENAGNIRIDEIYIKPLKNYDNDTKLVLTNNPNLSLKSYAEQPEGEYRYIFPYDSNKKIKELCRCIDASLETVKGKYGFLENETYYKGAYVKNFFSLFEKQMKENNPEEDWIGFQRLTGEDGIEEDHYKGIEIREKYMITCNEKLNVGDMSARLVFNMTYDKNVDKEQVYLSVQGLMKKKGEDHEVTQNVFSCEGSFTTCFNMIQYLVQAMCEKNHFKGVDVFKKDVSFFEKKCQ